MAERTIQFDGRISVEYSDGYYMIYLEGVDGYKIDLVSRVREAVHNWGQEGAARMWIGSAQRMRT